MDICLAVSVSWRVISAAGHVSFLSIRFHDGLQAAMDWKGAVVSGTSAADWCIQLPFLVKHMLGLSYYQKKGNPSPWNV